MLDITNVLWAFAETSGVLPEVFDSMRRAAAAEIRKCKVLCPDIPGDPDHQGQVLAGSGSLKAAAVTAVLGSDSEDAGLQCAERRQHES